MSILEKIVERRAKLEQEKKTLTKIIYKKIDRLYEEEESVIKNYLKENVIPTLCKDLFNGIDDTLHYYSESDSYAIISFINQPNGYYAVFNNYLINKEANNNMFEIGRNIYEDLKYTTVYSLSITKKEHNIEFLDAINFDFKSLYYDSPYKILNEISFGFHSIDNLIDFGKRYNLKLENTKDLGRK